MIQDSSAGSPERSTAPAIVAAGRNCRERVRATRVAFLIDTDAYFAALVEAVRHAREQVLVIGWDIQATARLRPGGMPDGVPQDLRGFLNAVVARRRALRVHLLEWDFSLLFSLERDCCRSSSSAGGRTGASGSVSTRITRWARAIIRRSWWSTTRWRSWVEWI